MKKAYTYSILIILACAPLYVTAQTSASSSKETVLTLCKKEALLKREKTMAPALKAYVASSNALNERTKHDLDAITWYIDSRYTRELKKIEGNRDRAMLQINNKISQARLSAQATWKAEDALCEFTYSSTQKDVQRKNFKNK